MQPPGTPDRSSQSMESDSGLSGATVVEVHNVNTPKNNNNISLINSPAYQNAIGGSYSQSGKMNPDTPGRDLMQLKEKKEKRVASSDEETQMSSHRKSSRHYGARGHP